MFPANDRRFEAIALDGNSLVLSSNGAEQRIAYGTGSWKNGRVALRPLPEQPAAASGAWTGEDTFKLKICFYETPFIATLTLKFSDGQVLLDSQNNVGFGSTKQSQLVGKAE